MEKGGERGEGQGGERRRRGRERDEEGKGGSKYMYALKISTKFTFCYGNKLTQIRKVLQNVVCVQLSWQSEYCYLQPPPPE